jgi:phosphoribosylanthranilate isomerase
MALATFVKISGVNNLSDARYCAGMEVNQLGFNIEPDHPNYISPEDFKELTDWVSGVEFVGEIEKSTDMDLLIANYSLDAIEIQHQAQLERAIGTGLKVIFKSSDKELLDELNGHTSIDYYIYEGSAEGQKNAQLLVTEGFDSENIKEYVATHGLKGIAMQGGNEIRPGFNHFDELADILEALDVDEFA